MVQPVSKIAKLPPTLRETRLNSNVKLGEPRFVPRQGTSEVLHAVFTMWDVLDAVMFSASRLDTNENASAQARADILGRAHLYQSGYLRELQLRRMLELVTGAHMYCEVGMNGGHSAAAMLLANSNLTAHVFDTMAYKYSAPVASLLRARFGARFELHVGKSHEMLPAWTAQSGVSCDLCLVDGDHRMKPAQLDMQLLHRVAAPHTRMVVDDIHLAKGGTTGGPGDCAPLQISSVPTATVVLSTLCTVCTGDAVEREQAAGRIEVLEQFGPFGRGAMVNPCMRQPPGTGLRNTSRLLQRDRCQPWGFAVARYAPAHVLPQALLLNASLTSTGQYIRRFLGLRRQPTLQPPDPGPGHVAHVSSLWSSFSGQ